VDWDARIHIEDRKVATNSYWIAQEAVTNAIKHGKPGTLWIRVFAGEHRGAVLTVRDDGTGFSATPARNGGMGLRIMKSRAELIGADLQVAPHPEGGTCVTCTMTRGVRVDP
jgi:signal transduction histidine kinase